MAVDYTFGDPIDLGETTLFIGDVFLGTGLDLEDEDGNAFDLDGQAGVAQVLTEPEGAVLFAPTVVCSGASVDWSSPAADTASVLTPGLYYLFVRVDLPGVGVKTIAVQRIRMQRGIIA